MALTSCIIGLRDLFNLFGPNCVEIAMDRFNFCEAKRHTGYIEFYSEQKLPELNIPYVGIWDTGSIVFDGQKYYKIALHNYEPIVIARNQREIMKLTEVVKRYKTTLNNVLSKWENNE
jgi:hypothetical protein